MSLYSSFYLCILIYTYIYIYTYTCKYACAVTHSYMWSEMGHVTRRDFTYMSRFRCMFTYMWFLSFIYVRHESHAYARHDSFIFVKWLIHICATWLIHMRDTTRSYTFSDPFIHVRHDSFICATWLVHICAVPRLYTGIPVAARSGSVTTKRTYNCTSAMLKSGACVKYDSSIYLWQDTCIFVRRDSFVYVRQDWCVHLHLSYAKVGVES